MTAVAAMVVPEPSPEGSGSWVPTAAESRLLLLLLEEEIGRDPCCGPDLCGRPGTASGPEMI
jgi:hypothetical protein